MIKGEPARARGRPKSRSRGASQAQLSRLHLLIQALPIIRTRFANRASFEPRLAEALSEALHAGKGFYLGGLAARRALGTSLILEIDPLRLERRLRHRIVDDGRTQVIRDKFLGAGDWTPFLDPLHEASTFRDVREVVAADGDYRQTKAYRQALQRIGNGQPISRNFTILKTPLLVEGYFDQIAALVRSIQKSGMVRRAEYRRFSHVFGNPRVRLPWVELAESDIGIAIGEGGEIYRFASGKHRTAIAQALELKAIPVEARVVHVQWLEMQIAASGLGPVDALIQGLRELDARPL